MYLELAEQPQDYLQDNTLYPSNPMEYYVQIPNDEGGFEFVREDMLDDLPDEVFLQVLNAGEYMSEGDYLASKASRMARRNNRLSKKESRESRKQERFNVKMTKQRAGEETGFQKLLTKGAGAATNIFGKGGSEPQEKGFEFTAGASDSTTGIMKSPVVMVGGLLLLAGVAYAIASRAKKK